MLHMNEGVAALGFGCVANKVNLYHHGLQSLSHIMCVCLFTIMLKYYCMDLTTKGLASTPGRLIDCYYLC